jgi:hypothetical protein
MAQNQKRSTHGEGHEEDKVSGFCFGTFVLFASPLRKRVLVGVWRSHFRHSRMLLAGIRANFGLDPRLKHSGVRSWDVVPAFSSSLGER